ncbi:MAG: hypothetical protein KGN35_01210 [Betaproteobacteria bacterium]|nr:hypothetical protein [Betaproteobacteria bacterium]
MLMLNGLSGTVIPLVLTGNVAGKSGLSIVLTEEGESFKRLLTPLPQSKLTLLQRMLTQKARQLSKNYTVFTNQADVSSQV